VPGPEPTRLSASAKRRSDGGELHGPQPGRRAAGRALPPLRSVVGRLPGRHAGLPASCGHRDTDV